MLVVAIIPQGAQMTPRVYATQSNVLEVLNALAHCVERRESYLFTARAISGFHADDRLQDATVEVKVQDKKFSLEDTVIVHFAGRTEYYRMSQVVRLFSDLT